MTSATGTRPSALAWADQRPLHGPEDISLMLFILPSFCVTMAPPGTSSSRSPAAWA